MTEETCRICGMDLSDKNHRTHWMSGECLMVYDERFPSTYRLQEKTNDQRRS